MKSKKFKFIFTISQTANLFHFISNLTNWHFSARPNYRKYWLDKTGPLTKVENKVLKKISPVFKRYNFGNKYWGKIFLASTDDTVWKEAKGKFPPADFEIFYNAAKVFEPRFGIIWQEERNLLNQWQSKLVQTSNKYDASVAIKDLNNFFNHKKTPMKVTVILLLSNPNSTGGGGNLGSNQLTLELSRYPLAGLRPVWLALWHEMVHAIWQGNGYRKQIRDFSESNKLIKSPVKGVSVYSILNEGITEALFPHGYLAKKHFGFPSDEYFDAELKGRQVYVVNPMKYWRDYAGNNLRSIAKEYIERQRAIDISYLKRVEKVLKGFSASYSA